MPDLLGSSVLRERDAQPKQLTSMNLRAFADAPAMRKFVYDDALGALSNLQPMSNSRHTLALTNVQYADPEKYSYDDEKDAILKGKTLARRLRGTWMLADAAGQVLGRKQQTLAHIPHVTDRGTFIHRGTEYTLNNQQRLRSGIFTRIKDNGEIEAHANILPGEGTSHRYFLDPEKGVFYIRIRQAKIPLMPLLRALGAKDSQLRDIWGPELLAANYRYDQPAALKKLYERLIPAHVRAAESGENIPQRLRETLEAMPLDAKVTMSTLGRPHKNLSLDAILDTTKKLLAVSRGEVDVDDRDSLAYQTFHGPEDLISERLAKDWGGVRRKLLQRVSFKGSLDTLPTNALNRQVEAAILHSGLGQCFDAETWVLTRRGFLPWPEVTDEDEFACLINGQVEYRKATRLFSYDYDGELIGCRTRRFSYLVTPNHRCWFRRRHRKSREKPAGYEIGTAEELFGKQRWHCTSLGPLRETTVNDKFDITWIADKHGNQKTVSVAVKDWADFLGWWLAKGSAFVDGRAYTVTLAQTNEDSCDKIEALLNRLPFAWRRSSNGTDYVIRHKGLYEAVMACGVREQKRVPRYAIEWPEWLLRRLFDCFMQGDGNEYKGYLKTELAAHGLARDLVEVWGRFGGTAQLSLHDRRDEGWKVYAVVSFSAADERCVESSAAAEKHGYDIHFRQSYQGKVYCAAVPGEMLYVLRDGKPHWSLNSLEEINPADVFDKQWRITRLGEGGIPSIDAIPDEARSVQPSHFGFIDPLRTPESFRTGIDLFLARGVKKGRNGKIYAPFVDAKTGKTVYKSPQDVADLAIAFPGALNKPGKRVVAMYKGRPRVVPREQVALAVPHFENAMSPLGNLIPMKSMVKGQRAVMAARMLTQALPLVDPEAPLVQSGIPGEEKSFEDEYGTHMGAVRAADSGVVVGVTPNSVVLRTTEGKTVETSLYNNFPYNRKTYLHQSPTVQVGQEVAPGDLLARSNYTDARGHTALGRNLRTAYIPFRGMNFEDAIVISESAATRLTSEHMYQHRADWTGEQRRGRSDYLSLFPQKLSRAQLDTIGDNGIVKPGTQVQYDDPLVLAVSPRAVGHHKVHKKGARSFADTSVRWSHKSPGVVTDVVDDEKGTTVLVKAVMPMQVGDKLSGRYGDKGIVSAIIPDDQMPSDTGGRPFEILLNPLGIISRTNPAQMVEAALGRIAEQTGQPIAVPDFQDIEDMSAWALDKLRRAGLNDLEAVIDAETGRKIPDIFTGTRFYMKLHHTAEGKGQGRGASGGHTQEGTPAKGGETGAKRLSLLNTNALLSHGATQVLRDASLVRGQRNEDYWLAFMKGIDPPDPKVPAVYEKFVNQLKSAGINVVSDGGQLNVMALTDRDIDVLAGRREVVRGDTVRFEKELEPVRGGLFDPRLTGGHQGKRWSFIRLAEPMPNPVMEDPIRYTLGLTKKEFRAVLAGQKKLGDFTGPTGVRRALADINVAQAIEQARADIKSGRKGLRDAAVRKLGYLKACQTQGIHPQEWVLNKVPVLPPQFRPISVMEQGNVPLVADANYLYKELLETNDNLRTMQGEVSDVGDERLAVYDAFRAVTGLGDPLHPKLQEKKVRGVLSHIFGSSPKFGTVQRRLIGSSVNLVGRAVISPNPDLDMDSVGIPEEKAWEVYRNFVIRRLRRRGLPVLEAARHVKERTPLARQEILGEMAERPVFIDRAPVLHRFGIMAFWPRLVKGDVLQVSPLVVGGFNADFDGDAMQYHVPVDESARQEAIELMMPSKNLLSPTDFKSPVHKPSQEYVGGLHAATSLPPRQRRAHYFATRKDAINAYRRGDINVDTPVEVPSR